MIRDYGRRRRSERAGAPSSRRGRNASAPVLESLEGRRLLSLYTGPTTSRPIFTGGTFFTVAVAGGGYVTVKHLPHGVLGLNLIGTNAGSTLNITTQTTRAHFKNAQLTIGSIDVQTGLLGAIDAPGVKLTGRITPLNDSVSSIAIGSIGPNAHIVVNGNLGGLTGAVDLGTGGLIQVGGNLTGNLGGTITLNGGQIVVQGDVSGSLSPSSLTVENGGQILVGHDLSGGINVTGNVLLTSTGQIKVGDDLGAVSVGQALTISGGQLLVGTDVTGAATVGGGLTVSNNGVLAVGRDFSGGLTVTGNLTLDSGGNFVVGRDIGSLTVNGNLQVTTTGGQLVVGGNVDSLQVTGALQGKGTGSTTPDLTVGLDLDNLTVLGGGANQGGIQDANIDVGKSIAGLDVRHGIFNSFITAGVLIDGTGQSKSKSAGQVGADGADAVLDSNIRAGVEIDDLTFEGNVRSNFASNPNATGYPTRIVAGEDRAGNFSSGGQIDNFQITGSLIDSVIAASVAPNGDSGTYPDTSYGAPPPTVSNTPGDAGNNTYDAPAGTVTVGTVGANTKVPNYTELSYFNETLVGVAYNTVIDPTIDDTILPGAINKSFASTPIAQSQLTNANAKLPIPKQSSVLGGVISTQHGDNADFAGIFAADTSGVFVGSLPS